MGNQRGGWSALGVPNKHAKTPEESFFAVVQVNGRPQATKPHITRGPTVPQPGPSRLVNNQEPHA
jgi:hypothetical protein